MKFFKENSYDVVKLLVDQIGMAIFSMALYTAASMALPQDFEHGATIRLVISIISSLFYFVILYMVTWELGAKDRIRIDSGRMERQPMKGFLLELLANVPNLVIAVIALIVGGAYILGAPEGFNVAFGLIHSFIVFIESMYTGVASIIFQISDDMSDAAVSAAYMWRTVVFALMTVFSMLAAHLGYLLGERNFKISSVFSGKKNK